MLTLRQRIFMLSGIAVGLVLAITLFLLYRSGTIGGASSEEAAVQIGDESVPSEPASGGDFGRVERELPPPRAYSPDEQAVRNVSRIFVERFGSRSSINYNTNIDDAEALATSRMKQWLTTQRQNVSAVYDGTTTRVMAVNIRTLSAGAAVVEVRAEQFTSSVHGALDSGTRTQRKGRVELLKSGANWKVNGFYWED